jgi:hypothetical protein
VIVRRWRDYAGTAATLEATVGASKRPPPGARPRRRDEGVGGSQCFGNDTFTLEIRYTYGTSSSRILRSQDSKSGASCSVWPVSSSTVQAERAWKVNTRAAA